MNDRLKYRIFYDNKIVYPNSWNDIESIYECLKQQIMWDCKIDTDIKFDHIANNLIFMQCTGLKDKNGKLIYEGDIVQYKDEVYGLCIGRIEWDNAHYELQYYTGEKYGWFSHLLCLKHVKNIEVIGNIYENKDLLNENS